MITSYALSILASETAPADEAVAFHMTFGELMVTIATVVLVGVTVALVMVSRDLRDATREDALMVRQANELAMREAENANARTAAVAINANDDMAGVATAALTRSAPKPPTYAAPRPRRARVTRITRKI
jgi:hypothetical protein